MSETLRHRHEIMQPRDSYGVMCPGPSLSDISCNIEYLGNLNISSLPRLIQVQVWVKHLKHDM